MTNLLLVATSEGLVFCQGQPGSWHITSRCLVGQEITAVIAREGVILAGTTDGVYRSDDLGQTWTQASAGLTLRHVRWLAFQPEISDFEFAGTEPAGIFVSHTGGEAWRACPEVTPLREAGGWYLPYSPEAGCVRGFAFHGMRAYAAVEVGGLLVSDDQGETWRLAKGSTGKGDLSQPPAGFIASDVHSVEVHLTSPDLVFAATNQGLYRSENGGQGWTNLYRCYCRALWVDPADAAHIIFGPASGVDVNGRIEESRDGGKNWQRLAVGPWPHHMVERFARLENQLLAILSNGELLAAPDWQPLLSEIENVNAVTTLTL